MNETPKYYVSQVLDSVTVKDAMLALSNCLQAQLSPESIFSATYGYGCNLHVDLCYREMKVAMGSLDKFIKSSVAQNIVIPGRSDLMLSLPEDRITILFCHEGDIHTGGGDFHLQKRLWATKPYVTFPMAWREGNYLEGKS